MDFIKIKELFEVAARLGDFEGLDNALRCYPLRELCVGSKLEDVKTGIHEYIEALVSNVNSRYDERVLDILFDAIHFDSEDIWYREIYYELTKKMHKIGFALLAEKGRFDLLDEKDRLFLDINEIKNFNHMKCLELIEMYFYPSPAVKPNTNYPYPIPMFYKVNDELVNNGLLRYQKYMDEKHNLCGQIHVIVANALNNHIKLIDDEMYKDGARMIYAFDCLTNFKYKLKDKLIPLYPYLEDYIIKFYCS